MTTKALLLAAGLLVAALLAYFALSTSASKSPDYSEAEEPKPVAEKVEGTTGQSDRFVAPRRMRSDAVPGDELSSQSRRRMQRMGRGGEGPAHRSNLQKNLENNPEGEESLDARQETREQVVARRTKQWITDADTDRDGVLSPSEAELGSPRLRLILSDFESADSNGDGGIDDEELAAAALARRAKRQEARRAR